MAAGLRVHTIPRWKQWQYTLMPWLPGVLLGLLFVGAIVGFFIVMPLRDMADLQGTTPQHSVAIVSSITYFPYGKRLSEPPVLASLALNGDIVTFFTHTSLKKNERVQVTYRIGKSGEVYVKEIAPEAKP